MLKDLNANTKYRFAVSAVLNGIETEKTISNQVETGSSETEMLEIPEVDGYSNALTTKVMSDNNLEIFLKKINGIDYFYSTDGTDPTIQSSKVINETISILPPQNENENPSNLGNP